MSNPVEAYINYHNLSYMKKLLVLSLLFTFNFSTAQEITGDWYAILKVSGQQLELVFHISETKDGYSATMDSPKQNAYGIPLATSLEDNVLFLKAPNVGGMQYEGTRENSRITGTFKQGGLELPLKLFREKHLAESDASSAQKPQDPKKPYPYVEEEVSFENTKDSVTLAGTLTFPEKEGKFPAVILISGSGAQNRNSEILGHKPFLVISDYLTRHGIAVLRYDDRGVGKSTGNFRTSNSDDFANDARAAVEFLKNRKEIDSEDIGIIGHSDGGMVAPMVAAKDKEIGFLVLLAAPGLRGDKLLLIQQELVIRAKGGSDEEIQQIRKLNEGAYEILNSSSKDNVEKELSRYYLQHIKADSGASKLSESEQEAFINSQLKTYLDPWMYYFLTYDPSGALKRVDVPVLALNGQNDLQVSPMENLSAIEESLKEGGNDEVTIKEYPGLNHLFQESATGSPDEYGKIEQTFSPEVLEDMKNWILKVTGN
jgi:pimeloyl-ACP methyl ester carboxylesterase